MFLFGNRNYSASNVMSVKGQSSLPFFVKEQAMGNKYLGRNGRLGDIVFEFPRTKLPDSSLCLFEGKLRN